MKRPYTNPLFVALDLDSAEDALHLAEQLSEVVGGFKIGPRLVYRYGSDFVKKVATHGPVFLDCKFFDIPSVMEASVQAAFDSGATLCTVHAQAGPVALQRLSKLEEKLNQQRPFQVLAVTILTSFSPESLPENWKEQPIADHVLQLAKLAQNSGIRGIVCSGEELPLFLDNPELKKLDKIVPGIRMKSDDSQDQKRVVEPKEALSAGATMIVVGRPIVESKDPKQAALNYACAMIGK